MASLLPATLNWRPIRRWSAAQLETIAARFSTALSGWAIDWELSLGHAQAWNAADAPAQDGTLSRWVQLGAAEHDSIYACAAPSLDHALHRVAFGEWPQASPQARGDGVAAQLASRCVAALAAAVRSACELPEGTPCDDGTPPADHCSPWSGSVRVRATLGTTGQQDVWLHLSPDLAARCLAAAPRAGHARTGGLARVADALHGQSLRIRATLSPLSLDLGSLLGLKPGDVVATTHHLHRPLHISLLTGQDAGQEQPLCDGRLGSRANRMAVALHPQSPRTLPSNPSISSHAIP